MALLLPHSVFVHIPKTGGKWVTAALMRNKLPISCIRHRNHILKNSPIHPPCCQHSMAKDIPIKDREGRVVFAFVRHPLSYYQSFWSFYMSCGWDNRFQIPREFGCNNFEKFVQSIIEKRPAWVSNIYKNYIGHSDSSADFVGKQENLCNDLIYVLNMAGEEFDEDTVRRTFPRNTVSCLPMWREKCSYTPKLKAAVLEAEKGAMEQFGYNDDYPEFSFGTKQFSMGMISGSL